MKTVKLGVVTLVCSLTVLAACSDDSTRQGADLNRVLDVASDTFMKMEGRTDVNESNVLDVFSGDYASNLNVSQPLAHPGPVGVKPEEDGSFAGYHDVNNNLVKDSGESNLFTLEVDAQNDRLIASNENAVHDRPFGGLATGLLAGMLIGNVLNRQKSTGANPANKKATPRAATARSRAGSGSHSSGK